MTAPERVRLYIGGLAPGVTEGDLKRALEALGTVPSIEMVRSRDRDFAFVDFEAASETALSKVFSTYSGCKWKGGCLRVEKAKEDFKSRLQKEWQADAEAARQASKETENKRTLARKTGTPPQSLNLFFPHLGKVKTISGKGTGRHKRSFQGTPAHPLEVLKLCACEDCEKEVPDIFEYEHDHYLQLVDRLEQKLADNETGIHVKETDKTGTAAMHDAQVGQPSPTDLTPNRVDFVVPVKPKKNASGTQKSEVSADNDKVEVQKNEAPVEPKSDWERLFAAAAMESGASSSEELEMEDDLELNVEEPESKPASEKEVIVEDLKSEFPASFTGEDSESASEEDLDQESASEEDQESASEEDLDQESASEEDSDRKSSEEDSDQKSASENQESASSEEGSDQELTSSDQKSSSSVESSEDAQEESSEDVEMDEENIEKPPSKKRKRDTVKTEPSSKWDKIFEAAAGTEEPKKIKKRFKSDDGAASAVKPVEAKAAAESEEQKQNIAGSSSWWIDIVRGSNTASFSLASMLGIASSSAAPTPTPTPTLVPTPLAFQTPTPAPTPTPTRAPFQVGFNAQAGSSVKQEGLGRVQKLSRVKAMDSMPAAVPVKKSDASSFMRPAQAEEEWLRSREKVISDSRAQHKAALRTKKKLNSFR